MNERSRRPIGVWIICVYIVLTQISSLGSIVFALSSDSIDTNWAIDYYRSFPWWVLVYLAVGASIWLAVAVFLFRLKQEAFPLVVVAGLFGLMNLAWQSLAPWLKQSPIEGGQSLFSAGLVVGLGVMFLIVGYTWSLKRRGILE